MSSVAQEGSPDTAVVISVAEQKLVVLRDGGWIKKFPISTSKFGLGDSYGSYKTPLGRMKVCQKIGNDLTPGAVLKQRHATGEILPVNAPGRDPIVTRIIWLEGLEPQNANARQRGIYIHGTVEENRIGEPVSYGCIRMRSKDVMDVFDEVPLDTPVTIIEEKLPRFPKYTPPKAPIIAAARPASPAPAPTPPPVIALQTRPNVERPNLEPSTKLETPTTPANPGATLALKGSILDAGLPEGPRMPALPPPPEPKDVPRFGTLDPGLPAESPFSLRGISRDLAPAKRVGESDATARKIVTTPPAEKQDPPKESSKPASKIAFRANGTVVKKP